MRTALPIPAFARGRSSAPTAPPRRQIPYRFTIGKVGLEATTEAVLRARNDPNAFVDFVMGPRLLPLPKIDWSWLPTTQVVMAPISHAMSGNG